MQYRLRTLLIVLALVPPAVALGLFFKYSVFVITYHIPLGMMIAGMLIAITGIILFFMSLNGAFGRRG